MTIVETLGAFTANTRYEDLPPDVANETKRIILDSVGCALAATDEQKSRIALDIAHQMGGGDATILGYGETGSVFGAAFVNGELINALDFDSIVPPGHVSPYVIPGALALAETGRAHGRDLVAGIAIAHEMSYRLGKAMDYLRDMKDGKLDTPKVYGYAATVFGATAAAMRVKGLDAERIAHGIGIAGSISPVNSHMAWVRHVPSTTIKYTVAGVMAQAALTAAAMGEGGHRGDLQMLDDPEFGYAAMIGSKRWEKSKITDGLGTRWGFVPESAFKPYPHCRVLHNVFDVMIGLLEKYDIKPEEIEHIDVQGEAFVQLPIWENEVIGNVVDAQFSIKHGIALAAQRVKPGKEWQSPELVYKPEVLALMDKVTHRPHPDYQSMLAENPSSRPTRVEVTARGQVFTGDKRYPKGVASPDATTYATTEELVAKYRYNAEGVLSASAIDDSVDAFLNLEKAADISAVMALFRRGLRVRLAS